MNAAAIRGIDFLVDEAGERKAVVIDLRRHREVWEDLYDTLLAESRRREPRESLVSVKRRLQISPTRKRRG